MLVNNYFIIGVLKRKIMISNKFKNAKFMFSSFLFFPRFWWQFDGIQTYMCIWRYLGAHVEINECAEFIQFTSSLLILLVHKGIIIPDNRDILNICTYMECCVNRVTSFTVEKRFIKTINNTHLFVRRSIRIYDIVRNFKTIAIFL